MKDKSFKDFLTEKTYRKVLVDSNKEQRALLDRYEKVMKPIISTDQYHAANLKLNRLKVGLSIVILIVGIINIILTLIK